MGNQLIGKLDLVGGCLWIWKGNKSEFRPQSSPWSKSRYQSEFITKSSPQTNVFVQQKYCRKE